ncbi:MAG TPA: hypothetical protein VGG69_03225 [Rhizomicrobium sp.]
MSAAGRKKRRNSPVLAELNQEDDRVAGSRLNAATVERAGRVEGPDFICVGMGSTATGWLFDQLKYHPDFWMPPVKELGYLKRETPLVRATVRKRLERFTKKMEAGAAAEQWSSRLARDQRDLQFLSEAAASSGKPRDMALYASLFRFKGDLLSGEITPGYSALTPAVISEIAKHLPDTKIFLMIRDPLERTWSATCKRYRKGKIERNVIEDPAALRAFLEGPQTVGSNLFPTPIVKRWNQNAPNMNFRVFLFDNVARDSAAARREILLHIGGDPEKPSGTLPAEHDRKSKRERFELTGGVRQALIDYFADELRACAEVLGGAATEWPKKYGL